MVGIIKGDEFESVIALSCIFLETETSEEQVEGIKEKMRVSYIYLLLHTFSSVLFT